MYFGEIYLFQNPPLQPLSSSFSSHSSCHCGGSSFSSSPVGIMKATTGLLHQPPILGGSASMAIPPSVTSEVQDVSSLAATPLTNVRVLPLMVSSHPSLLGSSRNVSGGVASPPLLPLGLVLQCLLSPPCLRLRCLCQLLSQLLSVLPLFRLIVSRYPPSSLTVITSGLGIRFLAGSALLVSPPAAWILLLLQTLLTLLQVSTGKDSFGWRYGWPGLVPL
jgi:hypothetical protein